MVRTLRKSWRRFKKKHSEALEFVGDFLGVLGLFAFLIEFYFLAVIIGG